MKTFPANFLWGAATSAYQVEGSPLADGAGASIWHRFAHESGRIRAGDTGDVACDHYRRWESDVELMKQLQLNAYRFSLSWSRILPEGTGRVNEKGLDFYRRLVDRLLARGITPNVTLYHWDLPAALEDRGGWTNRDVAEWFADYAQVVFEAFGDRVPMWATLNEPWVVVDGGHLHGAHAPGRKGVTNAAAAAHHLLLAHGAAVERYRALGLPHAIGVVVNLEPKDPASDSPEDLAATARAHTYFNEQYCDALFLGRYPEGLREIYGEGWREPSAEDMKRISVPVDFLGVNYYTRALTRHAPDEPPVCDARVLPAGAVPMTTGWEFFPEGLTRTLCWVKERYGDVPLYVTENGGAYADPAPDAQGRVHDPLRVTCYRENLKACLTAIERGVDLRGYFAWSLMDNLEWAAGFSQRFGLVHVDFATQVRTIKSSGEFYRDVIRTNGAALD
ncbi:MAG: GH1 family beta-glucosidase [Candidatus Eisenbacteria bacterium]